MTRLKLRDDAYYASTGEGICILTNSGEVALNGPSIFQWVDRLAPYLDGTHTLAELTASMPPERRGMTERVINALIEKRVVVEIEEPGEPGHAVTAAERHAYRREIGLLGHVGRSAERSFHAYRETEVLLVGAGPVLVECVAAALCSGSRRVRVVVTDDCGTDLSLLTEAGRRYRERDPAQRVTHTAVHLSDVERLPGVPGGAGIVVYASDRADVDWALALDRACGRAGIPLLSAISTGEEAWLGPFGPVAGDWPGWMGAWRRRLAMAGAAAPRPGAPEDEPFRGAAPSVVANQLIRAVVRLLSRTSEPAGRARMTRIDPRSLRAEDHGFLPHPYSLAAARCTDEEGLGTAVGRLRDGERVSAEEFDRRVTACVDPRLGVLGEVTERDFAQIPLAVSQVRVSDPVLLLDRDAPLPVVTGAGLSVADARRAAALRGLAAYGSLMVDPRRLNVRGDAGDPRTGDPDHDLASLRAGRWTGFVWGHGLADGRPHEIPATEVFPALREGRSGGVPPVGVAAGYDWEEAVRAGLLGRCWRLTLTEAECRDPVATVDWRSVALDAAGDRYRSMVTILGQKLDVYDMTGSPGVPTLVLRVDGDPVACASGFSFGEALRDGLAEVLLWHQARTDREADYAPAGVPPLPPPAHRPHTVECPTWTTDVATTAARLARLGWAAVAVPLDHDPEVNSVMPYLVAVVLTRA